MSKQTIGALLLGVALLLFAAGCKKKVPPPPPPPPPKPEVKKEAPPPPRPVISEFVAEPSTIQRGEASTLRWRVLEATSVRLDQGIGEVAAQGSRRVFPSSSTVYTLTAQGPGGTASARATVEVTAPPPPAPPPPPPPKKKSLAEVLGAEVRDAYFDFDMYNIRTDARAALTQDAETLKSIVREFPGQKVVIEGHCDERGSAEYNLGLGDRRAKSAKDFLVELGVPADMLGTISYGKERPQCTEQTEQCWQLNRRVHFSAGQ
jgi:peptidoglycan-associated lipoprotein